MKILAVLPLAAALAFGAATGAHALPGDRLAGDRPDMTEAYELDTTLGLPHHPCHGMASGTHDDRACGTTTGGPVGGLT